MLAGLAWYVFLAVVLAVLQRYTRFLTELNIFTLFFGFLIMRHGLTVPFDDEVNQWFAGISVTPEAIFRYHLSLYLMWTSITVGIVAAVSVLGYARTAPVPRVSQASPLPSGMNKLFVPALVVSLVILFIYQVRFNAAFWRFITGRLTPDEFRAMRIGIGLSTHYSINFAYRLSSIIRYGILPLFIYSLFFMRSRGTAWRLLFWVTFGMGMFLGISSGQKMPAITLLIGIGIAVCYGRGRIAFSVRSLKLWLAVAAALFVVFPYLYKLQYTDQDYKWRLRASFYRISSEYDRTLQLYFEVYPRIEPFLHGKSSPLVDSLLGIPMSDDKIPERFIPIFYAGPDYINTWNAVFIGVAWADFGYLGVIAESIAAGAVLYFFYYWFATAKRTALSMGLQVASMMAAIKLSEVSLTADFLSFGLLSGAIVYFVLKQDQAQRSHRVRSEQ
jgi:hypothetical protein